MITMEMQVRFLCAAAYGTIVDEILDPSYNQQLRPREFPYKSGSIELIWMLKKTQEVMIRAASS